MEVNGQLLPQQFYPREKGHSTHYLLESGLCRPQGPSREISFAPADNCNPVVQPIAIPTQLFRLLAAENCRYIFRIKHKVCIVNANFKVA
jgi:hypothetical protein